MKEDGTFEERERAEMDEEEVNGGESKSTGNHHKQEEERGKETERDGSIIATRMEEEEGGEGMPSESLQERIKETARQLQEMGFSPEEVRKVN